MSELAFNINGERFDLPETAMFWRVRRQRASGRGTPEVVYGDDGLPLIVPIATEIAELRSLVRDVPGRYRLDPVDEGQRACEGAVAAYVQRSESHAVARRRDGSKSGRNSDELLREVLRANSEMAKLIVEKFSTVMDSAAALIRAADGAGMPAREPIVLPQPGQAAASPRNAEAALEDEEPEEDDDEPGESESEGGQLRRVLESMATRMLPLVTQFFYSKMVAHSAEKAAPEAQRADRPAARAAPKATTGLEVASRTAVEEPLPRAAASNTAPAATPEEPQPVTVDRTVVSAPASCAPPPDAERVRMLENGAGRAAGPPRPSSSSPPIAVSGVSVPRCSNVQ